MVKLIFLIVYITFGTLVHAQSISVGVETDTTDYLVGDFINYKIEVITRKNIELLQPSLPDSIPNLDFISRSKPVFTENEKYNTTVFPFILAGYDSVTATIPEIVVEFRSEGDTSYKSITTDSLSVRIHTVQVSTAEEIKDVKSPMLIPYNWLKLLLWIAIALLVLVSARYFYKKYKQKQAEKPVEKKVIVIPHHIKAFRALESLEREQLWQQGRVKDYHSRITEIIRKYFEDRFNFLSLELTTTETMQHLKNIPDSEIIHDITFNFLSNADLVKFAKFQPVESVNEEMMNQAKEIVQKTIRVEKDTRDEDELVENEVVNVQ
ncbi:hypothetical protein ACFLSS_00730 [Bacteroidota bacterium]